jgi:hypothetical protein
VITTEIHGAPKLPKGYEYFVHIQHPTLSDPAGLVKPPRPQATVTVSIVEDVFGYMDIHSQYTEVTRAHLMGAVVAAATHAYEEWEDRPVE